MLSFNIPPAKMLIIKPSSLGDIIHSLPFLASVARSYPKTEIHWVVAKGLHTVLENNPLITKLWVINKDQWKSLPHLGSTMAEIWDLFRGLRQEKFDISVDLSGLLRSGLITLAAGARIRLGFRESDEGSPLFYTHKIEGGKEIHAIDRYLKIARFLGCDADRIEYPMAPLDCSSDVVKALPPKYIVISPSAGKEANRWPAERFGAVAAGLPLPSVIISSPGDKAVADQVVEASQGKAISLAGKTTLKELFAVIGRASCFLSNDTGPMHIAAALGVPVVAIFGPANPVRTGPYGSMHKIIRQDLDCSPCYAWKPCDNWRCMESIPATQVAEEVKTVLKSCGVHETA